MENLETILHSHLSEIIRKNSIVVKAVGSSHGQDVMNDIFTAIFKENSTKLEIF